MPAPGPPPPPPSPFGTPPPPPPSPYGSPPPPPPPPSHSSPPPPPPSPVSGASHTPRQNEEEVNETVEAPPIINVDYIPSKKPDFSCPYCMTPISTRDLKYFCSDFAKHERDGVGKPNTFTEEDVKKYSLRRVVGKEVYCCNKPITRSRICPVCEMISISARKEGMGQEHTLRVLPPTFYSIKNEVRICMSGNSASGKTQFITHFCDHIYNKPLPGIDANGHMDKTTRDIRDAIVAKKFISGRREGTDPNYLEPMLYLLERGSRQYVSVIYDIAGSVSMGVHDPLASKCIWSANNIIITIDPTTLDEDKMNDRVRAFRAAKYGAQGSAFSAISDYANWISLYYPNADRQIKRNNIAIVFTKMDLFYNDPSQPHLEQPVPLPDIIQQPTRMIQNNRYNKHEADAVSNAMKSWLREMGGEMVVNWANKFKNVRIFGVSSGSETNDAPPNRNLDPFLWLLYQNGMLR